MFLIIQLFRSSLPLFQVWHPISVNSSAYNKTGEVQLPPGGYIGNIGTGYFSANLSLNSSSQIEFQSGDVIGYYQPSDSRRLIWSVQTSGYTSYSNTVTTPSTSIDTNNVNNIENNRQPLIAVMFGKMYIYSYIAIASKHYINIHLDLPSQYTNWLQILC